MSNQEFIDHEFSIPAAPEKKCKYCYQSHPELHWDPGMEAYFHKKCLESHIEMEIKEAILKSKISFDDLIKERER